MGHLVTEQALPWPRVVQAPLHVSVSDRARDTRTDEIVALKKVRMDKEKDGKGTMHGRAVGLACCRPQGRGRHGTYNVGPALCRHSHQQPAGDHPAAEAAAPQHRGAEGGGGGEPPGEVTVPWSLPSAQAGS